ncbi:MAG: 2'-5' RNA ligase family protein [Gemmatimonadaceae bacterium]|nr:2'-5' RNA ligase family protein [Gemmatimonadaceae bacterium]
MQSEGIFILAELKGEAGRKIREINEKYDPRLARYKPPHLTITGSSGVGPIPTSVPVEELRKKLEPVASTTPVLELPLFPAQRFLQTNIVVLPLDHHGPLRELHDRIATSGLPFARSRHTFSPHCTLSLYVTQAPAAEQELLRTIINDRVIIDSIQLFHTRDPQPSRLLLELPLTGGR